MNAIQSVLNAYPGPWSLGSAILCSAASAEMLIRAATGRSANNPRDVIADLDSPRNLSANLGGALFYGLCAANIVPYTAIAGAVIFTGYSLATGANRDAYSLSKVVHQIYQYTIIPLLDHVVFPLTEWAGKHVIIPLAKTIREIGAAIANLVELPEHPVWYGVAALVASAAAYRGFFA